MDQVINPADRSAEARSGSVQAVLVTLAGLAVAITLGAFSDGVYHDDDICHYLFARDSWHSVKAMLHWWARPGYNIPTMFAAHFLGMAGCRAFSAIQTAAVAYLAYLIACRVGLKPRWAVLASALVWVQPLTMTLAATTLTETPAALYMTLAVWLYLRGNRVWACAAMSPALITRIETIALVPIIALAVIHDALREAGWKVGRMLKTGWLWHCAAAMLWAPTVYCLAAYVADLPQQDSPLYVLFRRHTDEYGTGPWYHYLARWPEASSLGVAAAAIAGAICLGRRGLLVTAMGVGLVFVHGLLFRLGVFATGGYARFLVPAAGLFAVLAAAGLAGMWEARGRLTVASALVFAAGAMMLVAFKDDYWAAVAEVRSKAVVRAIALAAVVAPVLLVTVFSRNPRLLARAGQLAAVILSVLTVVQVGAQVRPLGLASNCDGFHQAVCKAVSHIQQSQYRDRRLLTQHVLARFLRDRPETEALNSNDNAIERWLIAAPGTLFLWENKYCYKPHEIESTRSLYRQLNEWGSKVYQDNVGGATVEIFKREADWQGPSAKGPNAPTTRPAGRIAVPPPPEA